MTPKPLPPRAAFSPGEFAALFGKSQTWGYRQLYAGRVKAIKEYGHLMIPAAEVERVLAEAGIYEGLKKPVSPKSKREIQALTPKLKTAWPEYLARWKGGQNSAGQALSAALKASGKIQPVTKTTSRAALSALVSKSKIQKPLS